MNILLIAGGWSSEREVSLSGAKGVEQALTRLGHNVIRFDPVSSLEGLLTLADKADFAYIALHGAPGEDGLIQAMLDTVRCPYQGSGSAGSFLALNKAAAKEVFRRQGLATPDWVLLSKKPEAGWQPLFAYPIFIKSNTGGSSLGMERVNRPEDLDAALDRLFQHGGEFIAEPAVAGEEVTCGILGPKGEEEALPPILIRPKAASGIFDYTSKYVPGAAEEICPAPLPQEAIAAIRRSALAAHRALGLSGYSRSDFILQSDGQAILLETNTLPGMTGNSLLPRAAAAVGLSFDQLVGRLIELGLAERTEQ